MVMMNDKFTWSSTSLLNVYIDDTPALTPFADYADEYKTLFFEEQRKMHRKFSPNAVKQAKIILGKQKFCFTTWYKSWVWEGDDWRFFASKRGAVFEVREGLRKEKAIEVWHEFMKKAGI